MDKIWIRSDGFLFVLVPVLSKVAGPEVAPGGGVQMEVQDLGSDTAADGLGLAGTRLSDAEGRLSDAEGEDSSDSILRPSLPGGFLVVGF